jgi:hypothetical protein
LQGISRTYGETITVDRKNAFFLSLLLLLLLLDHEAWDLLRPLTQMALCWNWFRKVGRDQDHYPPCWLLKRVNKLKDHFGFLHQVRLNICRFLELKYLLTPKKTQLLLLAYMKPGPYF